MAQRGDIDDGAGQDAHQTDIAFGMVEKLVKRAGADVDEAGVVFVGLAGKKCDALADVFAVLGNIAEIQHAVGGFVEQFTRNINNLLGACGLHPRRVFFVEKVGDDVKG